MHCLFLQSSNNFTSFNISPSYEEAANNRDFLDTFDSTESDTSISKDSNVSAISKSSHMLSVAELSDRSKTHSVEVHVEESESIEITEAEAASIVVEPVAVPSPSLRSKGYSINSFLKTKRTPEKSKAYGTSVVPLPAHPVAATPTSKSGQGVVLAEEERKNVLECIEGISAEEVIPPYAIKKLETHDTSSSSMLKSHRDGSFPKASPVHRGVTVRGSPNTILTESYSQSDAESRDGSFPKASPVQRGVTVRGSPNTILTESYSQSDAGSIKASVSAVGNKLSVAKSVVVKVESAKSFNQTSISINEVELDEADMSSNDDVSKHSVDDDCKDKNDESSPAVPDSFFGTPDTPSEEASPEVNTISDIDAGKKSQPATRSEGLFGGIAYLIESLNDKKVVPVVEENTIVDGLTSIEEANADKKFHSDTLLGEISNLIRSLDEKKAVQVDLENTTDVARSDEEASPVNTKSDANAFDRAGESQDKSEETNFTEDGQDKSATRGDLCIQVTNDTATSTEEAPPDVNTKSAISGDLCIQVTNDAATSTEEAPPDVNTKSATSGDLCIQVTNDTATSTEEAPPDVNTKSEVDGTVACTVQTPTVDNNSTVSGDADSIPQSVTASTSEKASSANGEEEESRHEESIILLSLSDGLASREQSGNEVVTDVLRKSDASEVEQLPIYQPFTPNSLMVLGDMLKAPKAENSKPPLGRRLKQKSVPRMGKMMGVFFGRSGRKTPTKQTQQLMVNNE
jgi:hypothetical protein